MRPRPCFAMKFTASGVTNCAAMIRSPSFSRSASSTTMTILPARRSVMIASMELKRCDMSGLDGPFRRVIDIFQRHLALLSQLFAGFKFRRRLDGSSIELAEFDLHVAVGGLDG